MNIDLKTRSDDLVLLLAVIDEGSFSGAADALNIQVAKVSRAVSKVEKQLGVTILTRTTRRLELTVEGKQFVDQIREGLQQLQHAEDSIISQGKLPIGKLRVDAASPFIFHQLIPLMNEFQQTYPDIELELSSNEAFVDLIERRTDVAIRIGKLDDSTLHARLLGSSALHLVASPEYLAKHDFIEQPSHLLSHQLIGFSAIKSLNKWPIKGLETITPTIAASNGETIRQLALSGNGIACLSGFMINEDIAAGRLITLLESYRIKHCERAQVNAVFYKSSMVAKRISAFINFIQPRLTL